MTPDLRRTRFRGSVFAIAALVMIFMAQPALALTTTWIGNSGNWISVPTNWNPGDPAAGDDASLTSATSKTATLNTTTPLLNSVIVDGTGGAAFTLTQTYYPSGNLSASAETIGLDGIGVYNHNAGSNTVGSVAAVPPFPVGTLDRTLVLGFNDGSSGTYNKSSSGTLTVYDLLVGRAGTGEFNLPSGSLTVDNDLILGRQGSGIGTFNLSSGVLTVKGTETVGWSGVGTMNHTSGTHTIDGSLLVGRAGGSTGTFTMTSGSLNVGNDMIIGVIGDGTLTHTSGSNNVGGDFILGRDGGTTGNFTMTSGSLTVGGLADIGRNGTGNFTMTSGSVTTGGLLTLAKFGGSSGTFNITSGSVKSNNSPPGDGTTDIQINSGGTFNVNAATVTGDVVNDGTVNVGPKGKVTWNGIFTNNNAYNSDRSTQTFSQDLVVNPTGYLVATGPVTALKKSRDKFIVKEDFVITADNTQEAQWDTHLALLDFNKGTDKFHDLSVAGAHTGEPGFSPGGPSVVITDNYAWGSLDITNQTINLVDANTIANPGALYVNYYLTGVVEAGTVAQNINGPSGPGTYNLFIYYNPELNPYLSGTYTFNSGKGELRPYHTPVPPSVLLLGTGLLGLGALGWRRRKKG